MQILCISKVWIRVSQEDLSAGGRGQAANRLWGWVIPTKRVPGDCSFLHSPVWVGSLLEAWRPMTGPASSNLALHHLTLTVTSIEASSAWYQQLLGEANAFERTGPDYRRVRLTWPNGLIIGLTEHAGTDPAERFNHKRIGMDHVGLGCANRAEVQAWAQRIDECGFQRGPVEEVYYGWAVTARDPDNIPIEFFCFNDDHLTSIGVDPAVASAS